MTTFLVILAIVLFVLGLLSFSAGVKGPSDTYSHSGELTATRRRQLHRAARRARERNRGGLPWFGKGKRNRRRDKNFWDD